MISRDDALIRMRKVIERVTGDGKTVADLDNSVHKIFPVAISPTEGNVLRDWIRREGVSNTIKIGLAYGISALFICEGLLLNGHKDARHVVVDPYNLGLKIADYSYWKKPELRTSSSFTPTSHKFYYQDFSVRDDDSS
jgi:predicted O-methyltransferase YrrM